MSRQRFLIAYDIRDPARLRRVCRTVEEYGERLQYSVFVCDLSRSELIHARHQVEQQMNLGQDSVVIVDLGDVTSARFTFIGQRRELPSNDTKIL